MDDNEIQQTTDGFDDLLPDTETVECEELYAKAYKMYELDKVSKAVALLTRIVKRNAQFGKAYNLLGRIYEFKYYDYERAERYFRAAIAAAPKNRFVYSDYFYFLRHRNRFDEAKQYLEQWAGLGVEDASVAYEYAILLEMQGHLQQALRYYQKAATIVVEHASFAKYANEFDRCKRKLEMFESSDD